MNEVTDPASELASIATTLDVASSEAGDKMLANKFQVAPWSTEFVKIIACIYERADLVERIVGRAGLDDTTFSAFRSDIKTFKSAFAAESLYSVWNTSPSGGLSKVRAGTRFSYLQGTVRNQVAYPKLTAEEVLEFIALIDAYLLELEGSTDENEAVVQAIKDGLGAFRFQLKHTRWMGAGYALSSFQTLMRVFEETKRGYVNAGSWEASSVMQGFKGIIQSVLPKMKTGKDYADVAVWAYSGFKLLGDSKLPSLALEHLPRLLT